MNASLRTYLAVAGFALLGFVAAGSANAADITIAKCASYPERDPSQVQDCTPRAAQLCNGKAQCELPIGTALTDRKPADVETAPVMVKLEYRCGSSPRLQHRGPNHQNDYATVPLGCGPSGL